jgi:hypothetical protein
VGGTSSRSVVSDQPIARGEPWHGSWHGAPAEVGAMRIIGARTRGIYTGGAGGALGRATFNPLVQGSTPGAPPGKHHLDHGCRGPARGPSACCGPRTDLRGGSVGSGRCLFVVKMAGRQQRYVSGRYGRRTRRDHPAQRGTGAGSRRRGRSVPRPTRQLESR